MKKEKKYFLFRFILVTLFFVLLVSGCTVDNGTVTKKDNSDIFEVVAYPSDSIPTLEDMGITLGSYLSRAANGKNDSYSEGGIIISPIYNAKINGDSVPVYATLVSYSNGKPALQSFSTVELKDGNEALTVDVMFSEASGQNVSDAYVLCGAEETVFTVSGKTVSAKIDKPGFYTFCLNGYQKYAYTVFVREYEDEELRISELKAEYGDSNVTVYEHGVYDFSPLLLAGKDGACVYIRKGALLRASDDGTSYASLQVEGCKNITVCGRGTIDFTGTKHGQICGIVFTNSEDCLLDGITLINGGSWTVFAAGGSNVDMKDCVALCYRTNSDCFGYISMRSSRIENCFARCGDDSFHVKSSQSETADILFENCISWCSKARAFGVTGEVESDIHDVIFENCGIIGHDATWDRTRVCALSVTHETGMGNIYNIVFDGVNVYASSGNLINVVTYGDNSGIEIKDIVFRNIKANSSVANPVSLDTRGIELNSITALFENVTINGAPISPSLISFSQGAEYEIK